MHSFRWRICFWSRNVPDHFPLCSSSILVE
ncbi:Glycosyltransferase family 92 protein R07B7.12 [Caenorhabditis elegans]|uniref:Glycosyltransferase family 92 protein R07B7.12 n=1 Tax=Caenorhabditis elegans TaxID=6239 RepID=B2D6N1_CAEEL|nr:Glycosyltransferase family 92 protein R07B7.12 [Caenorhabditis elegans]CAQ35054.1 Glycosyltransferase family 92 protein R07B7.12 [Caenorhabditis elegans]|eukprot:NP_001122985.1 Glycosyltransferase family 92 protein R07B7.12 [Caenorhabditis elegans]